MRMILRMRENYSEKFSLSSSRLTLKVKLLFEVLLKGLLAVVILAVLGGHLSLRLRRPRRLVLSQRLRRRPPRH